MALLPKANWRRTLISFFIAFNITAILLGSPRFYTVIPEFRNFFYMYLWWARLHQGWVLFAPEVRTFAMKYQVEIEFKDLTHKIWIRPYPPNWDFFERHLAYNFQKFDLASVYLEKHEFIRRDYCSYVMRLYWSDSNPPKTLTLVRLTADWPKPVPNQPLVYDEKVLKWQRYILARYDVDEETKKLR